MQPIHEVVGLFGIPSCCVLPPTLVFLLSPKRLTANGCFLVYLWRHDRLLPFVAAFVFYWLEGNPLQISDASTHRPRSLDIRCLGAAVLVQHSWEGLFWRGYIFPRQELAFKQYTWFVHGCCWWTFHIRLKCATNDPLPIIFITSFVVQKTKNTWSDIIIHSLINGSGFLLVAFRIAG